MFRVFTCLTEEHDLRLVVLAGCVCFLASFAAISLFRRAKASSGTNRVAWLALSGAATGSGIWATHFIAMLAYEPGISIAYDIGLTATSLLLAVVITGAGLSIAVQSDRSWAPVLAGAVVGGGVATMHYTGMWALELPGRVSWRPELVALSILVGILFGGAALTVAIQNQNRWRTIWAAVLLTLAIVSHHFTAMGAVEILPDPTQTIKAYSLSPSALALAVAGCAILILGLSLAGAFADRRLQERDLQLATAVNNMSHGVVMFDADEKLVVCNDRYIEMYGLSRDIVRPGTTLQEVVKYRKANGTLTRDPDEYRLELLKSVASGDVTNWIAESKDGKSISVTSRPMLGGSWVSTHEDITERRRAAERIEYLAHHDALTELPNRVAFNEKLERQIQESKASMKPFALVCIDLDRFKEINDVFGHAAGDAVLQEVGSRLKGASRGSFLARLGGDEFSLIAAGVADPSQVATLAEELAESVAAELLVNGHQLRTGMSIGVAVFPTDGSDATALIGNADAALYRAKADGRGTVRFFEPEMDKRLRDRRAMQHDLRSAIERKELTIHFQPQAKVGGEVVAFEALLRWHHPIRGNVPPNTFIPLAEESGLILQLGEWVLRESCREAATWSNPIKIGVNLSPVQFRHGDLPSLVHSILLETGLPSSRLELEITEGVLIDDFSRTVSILRHLKALGVQIAMDDFGTGYSSLSYLQAFPFDKIKIDQGFIAKLASNSQSATIVRAVIGLARGLEVPVVAEGVETKEQLEFLTNASCDKVQGFFVGRPKPIEDYAELVGRPPANIAPLRARNVA
jgi:diguanylate cyclase (GGDEF)-like protein